MKKIINGKLYNTETANYVDWDWNGVGRGDFKYWREELYLKKTGEFFLYGEGGAMSQYAERYPDGLGSGERIIPLSENEAKSWMEKHSDVDKYIEIFGEVEE